MTAATVARHRTRKQFGKGSRVRTSLNPDCRFQTECHGSHPEYSGINGTIVAIENDRAYPGHPYVVKYDGWAHGKHTYCARLAGDEIELIDASEAVQAVVEAEAEVGS